jgi:hypothetical protein
MHEGVQKHPRHRVDVEVTVVGARGELRALPLEDVSLGGAFVRTTTPDPPGSFVRLKLPVDDAPLTLMGRVVHVIDGPTSVAKARAPGMGIQFDGLSPESERLVHQFIDALVERARVERERRWPARFVDATHIEVVSERDVLVDLWRMGLDEGTLYVRGSSRVGQRVAVALGPLALHGDVIDATAEDATLRLVDLVAAKRDALYRFVSGEADAIVVRESGRAVEPHKNGDGGLANVLGDARRLFDGIGAHDLFAAIGLPHGTVDVAEIADRTSTLLRRFQDAAAAASAPQRAKLDEAIGALVQLEPDLLEELLDDAEGRGDWRTATRAGEALLRLRFGDVELHARVRAIADAARA